MMSFWQELNQCYNDEWKCPRDSTKIMKKEENEQTYLFLAGLNKEFDEMRSRILGKNRFQHSLRFFFNARREEPRRKVM